MLGRLFFPGIQPRGASGARAAGGEAPAARASERRREFLQALSVAFLHCVSLMAAKRISKSIRRDAGVDQKEINNNFALRANFWSVLLAYRNKTVLPSQLQVARGHEFATTKPPKQEVFSPCPALSGSWMPNQEELLTHTRSKFGFQGASQPFKGQPAGPQGDM